MEKDGGSVYEVLSNSATTNQRGEQEDDRLLHDDRTNCEEGGIVF